MMQTCWDPLFSELFFSAGFSSSASDPAMTTSSCSEVGSDLAVPPLFSESLAEGFFLPTDLLKELASGLFDFPFPFVPFPGSALTAGSCLTASFFSEQAVHNSVTIAHV
jgi:hypothetical protein